MAMRFTKSHEREEGRRLKKGFGHSVAGLLTCWLPVVGLLLSVSGFLRVMVRVTKRHRARRRGYLAFSFIVLAICTGVLLGEIWVYSRDPDILQRTAQQAWTFIVGEENAGKLSETNGTEYDNMETAGFGVIDTVGTQDDIWAEGDWTDEDWAALESEFDWEGWEDEQWGDEWSEEDWSEEDWFEEDWSEEDWSEEDWAFAEDDAELFGEEYLEDDSLWLEEEPSEDDFVFEQGDLSGLTEEERAWREEEEVPGESSFNAGMGETILPPTE